MKVYNTTIHKASIVIEELQKLGFKIVSDPNIYDENIASTLSNVIEEHQMIAVIRRRSTIEVSSPAKLENLPSHYIEVENTITSSEKHISQIVLESLRRGRINNPDLLDSLEEEAEDFMKTT